MEARGMMVAKKMDEEAKTCLIGVIAMLYYLARYGLEEDKSWESAAYMARSLDGYAASLHPDHFDKVTDYGRRWPVTSSDLARLRRQLAASSANRTSVSWKTEEGHKSYGNAFGFLPDDEVEPGVSLVDSMKVYVYNPEDYSELNSLTTGPAYCRENQWGFEVLLHEWFLACPCRTDDPAQADFFFVPHYTASHLNVKTYTEAESDEMFRNLIPKLKHFNRSGGRDHLFVWGGGFGADGPFRSWRQYVADSIFLTTEPELWNPYHDISTPSFSAWKDILIPGRSSIEELVKYVRAAPPPEARVYLGDFVGWNRPLHRSQGGRPSDSPRGALLAMKDEPDLHIRQDVPYAEATHGSLNSLFCFVPRGKSAWSSRFFRVLFSGCVPVVLNDYYEPPFGEIFDSSGFLVRWPMRKVGQDMLGVLRSMSIEGISRMLKDAEQHRCWYVYSPAVYDHEHMDIQLGKLDKMCPRWKHQNAFIAIMKLLRRRKRASKMPVPGKAFHIPDRDGTPLQIDDELRFMTPWVMHQ
eukprot:TRINITY_DN6134_c4_g1_i1.p1 TRINITY_DN6134_c4_g1~~TRINITY_DN6134_c4_g1_i1.p1  ORF type:complete len:524 (-),score=76.10 TRINITY_DN6134_c4_g1_i1:127-1698(-)